MRIVPLAEATAPAWRALFAACSCACFCRYWNFDGTKNDWLLRSATEPERSFDEQLALLREDAPPARGLIALEANYAGDAKALGWMKLAPRRDMSRLLLKGPYRSLALGPGDDVWVIGCLLVHPEHRRGGVARALVAAADERVRAWGGRSIEAYPRAPADGLRLHDEEGWMGTDALFAACGFAKVAGEAPYPVMRKPLYYPTTRSDD